MFFYVGLAVASVIAGLGALIYNIILMRFLRRGTFSSSDNPSTSLLAD